MSNLRPLEMCNIWGTGELGDVTLTANAFLSTTGPHDYNNLTVPSGKAIYCRAFPCIIRVRNNLSIASGSGGLIRTDPLSGSESGVDRWLDATDGADPQKVSPYDPGAGGDGASGDLGWWSLYSRILFNKLGNAGLGGEYNFSNGLGSPAIIILVGNTITADYSNFISMPGKNGRAADATYYGGGGGGGGILVMIAGRKITTSGANVSIVGGTGGAANAARGAGGGGGGGLSFMLAPEIASVTAYVTGGSGGSMSSYSGSEAGAGGGGSLGAGGVGGGGSGGSPGTGNSGIQMHRLMHNFLPM